MSIHYRASHEPTAKDKFFTNVAPVITGLGASVVIIGALFKIQHWPGASFFLILGLGTEALLFAMFALVPTPPEPDWTIVYPELGEEYDYVDDEYTEDDKPTSKNLTKKLDQMMEDSNLGGDLISRLSTGMQKFSDNVGKMSDISDATVATKDYASNVKSASKSITEMNKAYAVTIESMSEMASASKDAKEYHNQVQNITKNLGALNAVYEMELQDANNHLKAMNKFYGNLSSAMENMAHASKESEQFKGEMSKLSGHLTSLNGIYGNMLAAMKG